MHVRLDNIVIVVASHTFNSARNICQYIPMVCADVYLSHPTTTLWKWNGNGTKESGLTAKDDGVCMYVYTYLRMHYLQEAVYREPEAILLFLSFYIYFRYSRLCKVWKTWVRRYFHSTSTSLHLTQFDNSFIASLWYPNCLILLIVSVANNLKSFLLLYTRRLFLR